MSAVPLLVTSASGRNGDGYSALLSFDRDGRLLGEFSVDDRIRDPRGLGFDRESVLLFLNSGADRILAIDASGKIVRDTGPLHGLNPGGGNFGPDGRYHVGLRTTRSIMSFSKKLDGIGKLIVPPRIVSFPRGFVFNDRGRLFLASGIGPNGEGNNTILAFDPNIVAEKSWSVCDPELSPLDITVAPNGNVVAASEWPFGASNATTSIREYDARDGHLVRVLVPERVRFRRPRGLRFGPDDCLYCAAQDEVVAFDFATGKCLGAPVELPCLNGQALMFFP
jgi:hypothetical protein